MANQENMNYIRIREENVVPPPPRLLLWLVVGLFVLLIAGGIGFIVFMQGNMGLSTLFDTGIKLAVAVTVIAVVAAVVLRKRLPRRLPLVIILLLFAGWIV